MPFSDSGTLNDKSSSEKNCRLNDLAFPFVAINIDHFSGTLPWRLFPERLP
jgi:hypothetical protein